MMRTRATLGGLMIAVAACGGPAPEDTRTVERWLLCEECIDGELDSVVALGDRAIPILEAALQGPSDERRANMRRQAEAMWGGMRDRTVITLARYLAHYDSNYVSSYQSRAATALQRIDTPETRAILLDALRDDARYRADVRRALGRSLGVELSRVAGDSQHAPLDSFVKVNPTVLVQDTSTGAGLEGVSVRFWVDSGRGRAVDSIEVTDSAGKAAVRWQLGSQPKDSINILRAVAAGRAVRFHAFARTPELRVVFLVQPRNGKAGQPITPGVTVAVQDAWGAIQTNVNQTVTLTVVGTSISSAYRMVAGVAQMAGLSIPEPGTKLVLRAAVPGAEPALSVPFEIVP
jgi:hypothetical protein